MNIQEAVEKAQAGNLDAVVVTPDGWVAVHDEDSRALAQDLFDSKRSGHDE